MDNVEGVTAEETTVVDSVENEAPTEGQEADSPNEEIQEGEEEQQAPEGMSDEEFEKVKSDPKVQEYIKRQQDDAIKEKTARQKAALKGANETISRKVEEIKKLQEQIESQKQINQDDFESYEEYEAAQRKADIQSELKNEKLNEAKAELEADRVEQVNAARETFEAKEAEVKASDPKYQENTAEFMSFWNTLANDGLDLSRVSNYLTLECDNSPALINYLGANPDKLEGLVSLPPSLAIKKLESYTKSLSAPPPAPKVKPLPEPLGKTKGAAKPTKNLYEGDVLKNLGLKT